MAFWGFGLVICAIKLMLECPQNLVVLTACVFLLAALLTGARYPTSGSLTARGQTCDGAPATIAHYRGYVLRTAVLASALYTGQSCSFWSFARRTVDDTVRAFDMAIARSENATRRPIERLVRPFQAFAARESSGGILLLLTTLVALVWANSPWADSYFALWHTTVTLGFGAKTVAHDLHFWVNDALMALFFFVVGLGLSASSLLVNLPRPGKRRCRSLPLSAAFWHQLPFTLS
jgi:hypothetical protein